MDLPQKRYPDNWHRISRRILARANNHCERCGAGPHAAWGQRDPDGRFWTLEQLDNRHEMRDTHPDAGWTGPFMLILQVAHLGVPHPDGTPGDKTDTMDCREENLQARCQSCYWKGTRDAHR